MSDFLLISPYFPPMNYVGAKRALHFCRHLPAHGWTPAVVALPADIERDAALDALVPDVPLLRNLRGGPVAWLEDLGDRFVADPVSAASGGRKGPAKAKGPLTAKLDDLRALAAGTLGVLDRFAKYLPWALPRVIAFARKHRCKLVYANSGPVSANLLADAVARALNLPVVHDLRDPWSLEPNFRARWNANGAALVERLEAAWFARADRVILNTRAAYEAHVEAYADRLPAERFTFIRNQFDPDLYGEPAAPPAADDPFRIIYYGHLRPSKNAGLFVEALHRFIAEEAIAPGGLEFHTFGDVTRDDAAAVEALGLTPYFFHRDWLPFTDSPSVLGGADLLLDLMGPGHHLQISGKIYDYFAAGRRILAISPNHELDDIFAETGAGTRVDLNADAIVKGLRAAWRARKAGAPVTLDPAR
ncbi:MAG: glycosyltransferase, partial [Myxococcales bacterium]|nr:glycosyltransferase [Myxococcales bacterium]